MPLYFLYTGSESGWTYSGYQLSVAGSGNGPNGLNVQARTYDKSQPGHPGQWQTLSGVSLNGNGNGNSPSNGDDLGLPATIGTVTNIEGDGTYSSTGEGTQGAGYYTSSGAGADEGDWCATSN